MAEIQFCLQDFYFFVFFFYLITSQKLNPKLMVKLQPP